MLDLPFLDDEWDDPPEGGETGELKTFNDDASEQTNEDAINNTAIGERAANDSSSAVDNNNHTPDFSAHNRHSEDATSQDAQTVSNTDSNSPNRKPLLPEEKARLASLKTMLDASNARYQQASRNRPPVFAAGLEVKVINGEHAAKHGTVLDADYIENRALVSLPDEETPHWIGFKSLGHPD